MSKSLIPFSVGDYCLVRLEHKNYLVSVESAGSKICKAMVQKNYPYTEDEVSFEASDVIANFGQDPTHTGYEVFRKYSVSDVGKIYYFVKAGKETRKKLEKEINKCFSELGKRGLASIFPIVVEVRPEKGKVQGYYKLNLKSDVDYLGLRASRELDVRHTFFHEIGHGIFNRLLVSSKDKSAWVSLYNTFIDVKDIDSKAMRKYIKGLIHSCIPVADYIKSIENEAEILILKEILSYVKKYHRLSIKDLNIMIESGETKELEKVFPKNYVSLAQEKSNGVSDYSTKSPEEFFCESFAHHMTGKSLPSSIKKLMEKTLQRAAR